MSDKEIMTSEEARVALDDVFQQLTETLKSVDPEKFGMNTRLLLTHSVLFSKLLSDFLNDLEQNAVKNLRSQGKFPELIARATSDLTSVSAKIAEHKKALKVLEQEQDQLKEQNEKLSNAQATLADLQVRQDELQNDLVQLGASVAQLISQRDAELEEQLGQLTSSALASFGQLQTTFAKLETETISNIETLKLLVEDDRTILNGLKNMKKYEPGDISRLESRFSTAVKAVSALEDLIRDIVGLSST